jgi:quinol monooxygenase YgiN
MFAMFGKLTAASGQREELLDILLEAADVVAGVDGSRLYLVNVAAHDADGVFVYELWDSADAHRASLEVEAVRSAISRAMPLLVGPPNGQLTLTPVGGLGMPGARR